MMAVAAAWARGFWRDRAGVILTLLLPPLVYLLFAAIFGAGARGDIDTTVVLHDASRTPATAVVREAVSKDMGARLRIFDDREAFDRAVIDGRADAGILIRQSTQGSPKLVIVSAAGRDVAASALQARLEPIAAALSGQVARPAPSVQTLQIGPQGDVQATYYAGAVSVMFVFFAAMHGAMGGLDERRSGLQSRLALARGGLAPILGGRAAWLTAVGVMQSAAVFVAAWIKLPALEPWQMAAAAVTALAVGFCAAGLALALTGVMQSAAVFVAAWVKLPALEPWQMAAAAVTALAVGFCAAGLALALTAACRSREQAQPLTTFVVLLLAALGGSMAPRFLMPEAFRDLGWITPHAWAIEAYQAVIWRGEFTSTVIAAWAVMAGLGVSGLGVALMLERRRAAR